MTPKHDSTKEKRIQAVLIGLLCPFVLFFAAHFFFLQNKVQQQLIAIEGSLLEAASVHMILHPFELSPFPLAQTSAAAVLLCLAVMAVRIQTRKNDHRMPGIEGGSSRWNTNLPAYNRIYSDPKGSTGSSITDGARQKDSRNMILTETVFMSLDTRQTLRNNNVLIIGGSGTGKTRFFAKPNILQANCSYVITDPSGELLESCGSFLEQQGYRIRIFNLVEMQYSDHYNPFTYIRNDEGILIMIHCLIENTTPKGAMKGDPFWEKSETALLLAICFYLHYEIDPPYRHFGSVMALLLEAQVREDNEDYKSVLDIMFETLEEEKPSHIAVRYYKIFKMGAGRTLKSILISCTVRLGTFNLRAVQNLTCTDTIDLLSIGDVPTALFVVIPSADTTFNYLVSMMYSQLFESLYFRAENECEGKRLPIHVRFLLDEFANIGTIPDFEKKLATMRKYEISCSVILQNLSQLKTLYKDSWESITGNCDSFLFLGGQEQSTLEYVSKKLGKRTILSSSHSRSRGKQGSRSESEQTKGRDLMTPDEISRMDNRDCILFIRGLYPFFSRKFDYTHHPNYILTGDNDRTLLYEYRDPARFYVRLPEENENEMSAEFFLESLSEATTDNGSPLSKKDLPEKQQLIKKVSCKPVTLKNLEEECELKSGSSLEEIAGSFEVVDGFAADYEFQLPEGCHSNFFEENVENN